MSHIAEECLKNILKQYENGLYAEAIEVFDHAFQINSNELTPLNTEKSEIYGQPILINADDIMGLLSKAILTNSMTAGAYYFRGEVNLNLNRNNEAINDLNMSIQIDPKNVELYAVRGYYNHIIGDIEAAISDYSKAIQMDSENAYSYYHLGSISADRKDYKRAISNFCKVIEIFPKDTDAYLSRAIAFNNLGESYSSLLDLNCFFYFASRSDFFQNTQAIFRLHYIYPSPYLLYRTLEKLPTILSISTPYTPS